MRKLIGVRWSNEAITMFFNPEKLYEAKVARREKMEYDDLTVEQSAELDDLLWVWFQWADRYMEQLGQVRKCPYIPSGFASNERATRSFDDLIAEQVDLEIDKLPVEHRMAVGRRMLAKKQKLDKVVRYHSIRDKMSHDRIMQLYREAKVMLYLPLKKKELLKC